jgi:hypothetical protein
MPLSFDVIPIDVAIDVSLGVDLAGDVSQGGWRDVFGSAPGPSQIHGFE